MINTCYYGNRIQHTLILFNLFFWQLVNEFSVEQLISCEYNPSKSLDGCQGGALISVFDGIKVWRYGWID